MNVLPDQHPGGEELRLVEKDVLIPKRMKEKAMIFCTEYVKAFEDCARGRTVSMVWACRKQNKKMQSCLVDEFNKPGLFEQCKQEYLRDREQFQTTGVPVKKYKRGH